MSTKKLKFPGFDACMHMMRKRNAYIQEEGFHALRPHAAEFLPQLIEAFHSEEDRGLRCWLLELIGEARSTEAFPILQGQLTGDNESFRYWAIVGLKQLDTKEARKALWEARSYSFATPEETLFFQEELERVLSNPRIR
jgi:hypothetical protein